MGSTAVTREEMVGKFHAAMGSPINQPFDLDLLQLRRDLIEEEYVELRNELLDVESILDRGGLPTVGKVEALIKELADLQYVLSGFADTFGIDLESAFKKVHESNMSKLVEGGPLKREDGKVLKGPNYKAPDLYEESWALGV